MLKIKNKIIKDIIVNNVLLDKLFRQPDLDVIKKIKIVHIIIIIIIVLWNV